MNLVTRAIWLWLNLAFGAGLAYLLFIWVACDMQMPVILINILSQCCPQVLPLFRVPYIEIEQFASSITAKLLFNAFLYVIFGFVHTFFAQEFVQAMLGRFLFPKPALRTVFCILVTITSFLIMGFWQHTGIQLWNILPKTMSTSVQQVILLLSFFAIHGPGWYVVMKFDPFEFVGLRQLVTHLAHQGCPYKSSNSTSERTTGQATLVTSGLFQLCRHPLYLFTILGWLITPVMSLDRLTILIYTGIYAAIGIPIEERKLVQIFGQAYVDYQKRVPAVIPNLRLKRKTH